jgi:hypothetical protein
MRIGPHMKNRIELIGVTIVKALLVAVVFGVAGIWFYLIAYSEMNCPLLTSVGPPCSGERGDVWMLPFFGAVFGIPALILSIVIIVMMIITAARRKRL